MKKTVPHPLQAWAWATGLLGMGLLQAQTAPPPTQLPQSGKVAAGSASISSAGSTLTVQQNSARAIIDWKSFNLGSQAQVNFNQPSAAALTLNRVLDSNPSQIMGRINAPGQVFIVNPNGVLFGATSQVDVGGLLVTTHGINNANFMAGKSTFEGNGKSGSVVNLGSLQAKLGGYIAMLAPQVRNEGVIIAREGTVAMAGGNKTTLVFNGQSLTAVQIDQGVMDALVENKHVVKADGGLVVMTARSASVLMGSVVRNSGAVQAQTIANKGGRIMLIGDMTSGTTEVSGTLDASAPNGGNGGFIETSAGQVKVSDAVRITTLASQGQTGKWLIDPINDYKVVANTGVNFANGDITGTTLGAQLASNNIELQSSNGHNEGSGNVNISDRVEWSANTTLTLTAANDVNVYSNIVASGNTAGLVINPNGGTFNLQMGKSITLSGSNPSLSIAGQSYTVINTLGAEGSTTAGTLQGMQGNVAGRYALGVDINALPTSASWTNGFSPIGQDSSGFSGQFHGLGHTISNLSINASGLTSVGLFGKITSDATISNVGLVGGSTTAVDATHLGGLVGLNEGGTITKSYNTGTVSTSQGTTGVGGLVGGNDSGSVSHSYATGNVSTGESSGAIGGLVGFSTGTLSNSFAGGNVTAGANSGQGLGTANKGVGGLVGYASGTVANSYATGHVQVTGAANQVGGFIGLGKNLTLTNSYATGNVSVSGLGSHLGGFVGNGSSLTLTNAFATGAVSAGGLSTSVGGFIGHANGSTTGINNAYSTGLVTIGGSSGGGGFSGGTIGAVFNSSYWNTQTSGRSDSAGGTSTNTTLLSASDFLSVAGWSSPYWHQISGQNNDFPVLGVGLSAVYARADSGSNTYGSAGSLTYKLYTSATGLAEVMGYVKSGAPVWSFGSGTLTGTTIAANTGANTYAVSYKSGLSLSNNAPVVIAGTAASWTTNAKALGMTVSKAYDGNTTFSTGFQLTGMVLGQSAPGVSGSATVANKNVGSSSAFETNDLVSDNPNYRLTGSVNATITPKPLTAVASVDNKFYDGNTTAAAPVITLTGLVGEETLTTTGVANFQTAVIGQNKTVDVTSVNKANGSNGGLATNYSLPTTLTTTASINAPDISGTPLNLTQVQLAALTPSQMASLTPAQLASLTGDDLSSLSTAQFQALSGSQMALLTLAQFEAMTDDQLNWISLQVADKSTDKSMGNLVTSPTPAAPSSDANTIRVNAIDKASASFMEAAPTAQLSPAKLQGITPAVLVELSPAQVANLTTAQIQWLSPTQVRALSPAHMAALSNVQLQSLSPIQLQALDTAQIAALAKLQLQCLSCQQLKALTPQQMAELPPAVFKALINGKMGCIKPQQLAALNESQLKMLTNSQMGLLTGEQLQALAKDQLNVLTSVQIQRIKPERLQTLSPDQVAQLGVEPLRVILKALTPEQLQVLTPQQIAGLSVTDLALLKPLQIQSLSALQIAALPPELLAQLDKSQWRGWLPSQIAALSDKQLASLTPDQRKAFNNPVLLAQPTTAVDLSIAQSLNDLPSNEVTPDQLKALTPQQIRLVNKDQIQGWNKVQISALSTLQFESLLPEQLAAISPRVLASLDNPLIKQIQPVQVAAFTSVQLNALLPAHIQSLSPAVVAALTPEQFKALSGPQISSLLDAQIPALSKAQLQALTPEQVAYITPLQIAMLSPAQLSVLSPYQISLLKAPQVSGLTQAQVNGLFASQIAALTKAQIGALRPDQVQALGEAQLGNMSPAQFAALQPKQLQALQDNQIAALSFAQLDALSPTQWQALTLNQFSALSPSVFGLFSKAQIQGMTRQQFAGLSPQAIAALGEVQLGALTTLQMTLLNAQQLAALSPSQLQVFNALQLGAINPSQLLALSNAQLQSISPMQIGLLNPQQLKTVLPMLNPNQLTSLTPSQVAVLNMNQLRTLSPAPRQNLVDQNLPQQASMR